MPDAHQLSRRDYMKIVRTVEECRQAREQLRALGSLAFVPTMGFLHEGHLSLIRMARTAAASTAVSIFVNPTQFGPNEDLDAYPRDFERDEALCRAEGVDLLFYPRVEDMYSPDASVGVVETRLSKGLCGASRPGHFDGVCTVVAKLFNILTPDVAVFGEKDAQQLRVIRRMVRDLNIPVELMSGPIVREPDGVAMSSRNVRLSPLHRTAAAVLPRALKACQEAADRGETDVAKLDKVIREILATEADAEIDYIAIVDNDTLEPVDTLSRPVLVALAVRFGDVRLIDNTVL